MELNQRLDRRFKLRIGSCSFVQSHEAMQLFAQNRPNADLVNGGLLQTNNQHNMLFDSTNVASFYMWGFRIPTTSARDFSLDCDLDIKLKKVTEYPYGKGEIGKFYFLKFIIKKCKS